MKKSEAVNDIKMMRRIERRLDYKRDKAPRPFNVKKMCMEHAWRLAKQCPYYPYDYIDGGAGETCYINDGPVCRYLIDRRYW